MTDMQSLINREPSPLWAPIVAPPTSSSGTIGWSSIFAPRRGAWVALISLRPSLERVGTEGEAGWCAPENASARPPVSPASRASPARARTLPIHPGRIRRLARRAAGGALVGIDM